MERVPSDAVIVELLADRPDLIRAVALIRWREWGGEPGRQELHTVLSAPLTAPR